MEEGKWRVGEGVWGQRTKIVMSFKGQRQEKKILISAWKLDVILSSVSTVGHVSNRFFVCYQDVKEQLTSAHSTKKEVIDNTKKLKQSLNESVVSSFLDFNLYSVLVFEKQQLCVQISIFCFLLIVWMGHTGLIHRINSYQ